VPLVAEQVPQLEKYEVLEEIGHGGMATVYRARDRRLGRDVAIKVIHKHLRENKEVAARFVSEARAVAKLKHPNIVEVYDVSDEADAERYLIVELVNGTTLRKLLAERGHMPAEIAAALGIELAQALHHAHEQGVVHRDVKPENVLVDLADRSPSKRSASSERPADAEAGRVKLTDFGIAKLLDAQGVTSTGQVLGSPAHMAPEQIEGGDVSARADVFGMGVLLYECMVGRLPFDGKNPAQVLRKVLDGAFTPPERARPTVGTGMSRIVERALAREANDRFPSAGELSDALRAELSSLGFENPRRELTEYLLAPESYAEDYEARIVTRLVELGKVARNERRAPQAAAYFNRALAFRPDDAELLKQVAGLAQSERRKRLGSRAALALGASLLCGGITYGIVKQLRAKPVVPVPEAPLVREPILNPETSERVLAPSAVPSQDPSPDRKLPVAKLPTGVFPLPSGSAAASGKTRMVSVFVRGARGGLVYIDGSVKADWFGKPFPLTVGPHTIEVKAPDPDCCIEKGVKSFTLAPGDDVYQVSGEVEFKPARITMEGPEGAEAVCSQVFGGKLVPNGVKTVKLPGPDPTQTVSCTLTGPPSGSPPKVVQLKLRPGQTHPLSW